MKAVLFHRHGGPEVLEYTDFPTPDPGPAQALIKLKFAALNHMDLFVRQGWPGIKLEYPHILGADGAGEIVALGSGASGLSLGERVVINANLSCGHCEFCRAGKDNLCRAWQLLGETVRGTYCEFIALPVDNLCRIPPGFDEQVAVAATLVYQTAWHSLITRGKLRPGESVLIVGASGGVNTASIQIAKLAGASVYVVGSDPEKLALAESLGADYLIDRQKEENWSKTVFNLTNKRGVDVVVDNVGTTFPLSFRSACKGGRILTVGNSAGPKFEIDNRFIFSKHLSIIGSSMAPRRDFYKVMELVYAGKLKPVIDRVYPLSEAHLAHERLEKDQQMGKIILAI